MRLLDDITDSMGMSLSKLPEDGEGQGSLVCCSPWGLKESGMSVQLNNTTILYVCVCVYTHTHIYM